MTKSRKSKFSKLVGMMFICRQKKKKPKKFISYSSIEIQGLRKVGDKAEDIDCVSDSCDESLCKSKLQRRNPESATLSSQNTLPGLLPALLQFKLSTAKSRENLKCESPSLPGLSFDPVGGEGRKERGDLESHRERLGVIEERWKQLSSNNLCYVARMEAVEQEDQVGGRLRRTRSSLSLSPLSRWV